MSAAFTPGPWTCEQSICDGDVCFDIHQVQIDGKWVPGSDVAYSRLFKTYVAEHLQVQKANAQLIAAAPELLEMLQRALIYSDGILRANAHADGEVIDFETFPEWRAVIAKATGAAA